MTYSRLASNYVWVDHRLKDCKINIQFVDGFLPFRSQPQLELYCCFMGLIFCEAFKLVMACSPELICGY
jgi:hypothetical protein